jgi:hypothetical protein
MGKAVLIIANLVGVLALSGCHGGTAKIRWVNQADSNQVMEFQIQDPSIFQRAHMAIVNARLRGSYVMKNAEATVEEGKLTIESPGYLLQSREGTKHRLEVDASGSLKAENGVTWIPENRSRAAVTLKKW